MILNDFHLVEEAAPALLKTTEEASMSTVFIILADSVSRDLVTVASRCIRIDFCSLSADVIEEALVSEGIEQGAAHEAALAASGNLDRARLLAVDDSAVARRDLWRSVLGRLDGTGTTAATTVDEIVTSLDHASKPLAARQKTELQGLVDQFQKLPGSVQKQLEDRHKRELRRLRTDELRSGLALVAEACAARMEGADSVHAVGSVREMIESVDWANASLTFNPNETLLLQGLMVRLSQAA